MGTKADAFAIKTLVEREFGTAIAVEIEAFDGSYWMNFRNGRPVCTVQIRDDGYGFSLIDGLPDFSGHDEYSSDRQAIEEELLNALRRVTK